jgi:hypothetical protein
MFFNLNSLLLDEEVANTESIFDLDKEIDSLAIAIKIRTLVVPLGQRCPAILENFLNNEEKYRVKLKKIFIHRHRRDGWHEAKIWLKKYFSYRWQLLVNQF